MARHWIFDLDGTLIDSHPLYNRIFKEVAEHFKVPMTSEAWTELPHIVLPKFLEKYFPIEHRTAAYSMVVERNYARQNEIEIYTGMTEILDHLQSAGCVLSLCTAREYKTAKGILEVKNLEKYFKQIITRDCVPQTKPHPEGIQRLMSISQTTTEETVMIGDHRMDVEAARGAGVKAVSVGWNTSLTESLEEHSDHHFSSVVEFHAWVKVKVQG